MPISDSNRYRLQKIIKNIEADSFDLTHVRNLLFDLRSYCTSHHYYREVADFIAHDERNKGITFDTIERFYLFLAYFMYEHSNDGNIDLTENVPLSIKMYLLARLKTIDDNTLLTKINYKRQDLISHIQGFFEVNKIGPNPTCKLKKTNAKFTSALKYLTSSVDLNPAFTEDQIINDLISVIKQNNFEVDENVFFERKNKIVLCVLALLHDSYYNSEYGGFTCKLESIENKLCISVTIHNIPTPKSVVFNGRMFISELIAEDWCTDSFFDNIHSNNIQINSEFKLERI